MGSTAHLRLVADIDNAGPLSSSAGGGSATAEDATAAGAEGSAAPVEGSAAPVALSEAELVAGLKAGDPAVCDRVYRLYARGVWGMLQRLLGADPELDDVHHEVFVQALQSAEGFRGDCSLRTWLTAIAVNCARAKLRRRRRKRWLTFMAPEDLPEAPAPSNEAAGQARAVYAVLARLPDEERIAFSLRYVEGLTLAEVGAAMETSLGTVKRRLRKASQRFFVFAAQHPELAALCADQAKRRAK